MKVPTILGLIDHERLEVKDFPTFEDNCRKIVTQYFLDGELVRQSVYVELFQGLGTDSGQGEV